MLACIKTQAALLNVTGEGRGLTALRCESPFQPGQAAQVESSNSREQTRVAVTVETVTAHHLHTLCFLMAMESHPQATVRDMPVWGTLSPPSTAQSLSAH